MVAVVVLMMTAVVVMMLMLHLSSSLFENLKIFGRFAADLRGVASDLVECIDKRWIFGLDTTTNR